MDAVRKVEVKESKDTADLRKALDEGDEFALYVDGEPVARVVPLEQVVAKSENYFKHYPHDASECLYTCWRHPRVPVEVSPE